MVCNVPVSCKANGDRNQLGASVDSDLIYYSNFGKHHYKDFRWAQCIETYGNIYSNAYQSLSSTT